MHGTAPASVGKARPRLLALVALGGLGLAACGSSNTTSPSASGGGGSGVPSTIQAPWGSFTLASNVADKVRNKQTLNFVLSFQTLATVGAPAYLAQGMKDAAAQVQQQYGITVNTKVIGPAQTDPVQQISQVQQAVNAGQVDCLAVEPVTPDAFVNVINSTADKGIPTFTVNTDSSSAHRFAYYGPNDTDPSGANNLGKAAGDFFVNWAKQNSTQVHKLALITGDSTAPWAQGRMQSFVDAVKQQFPSIQVVGSPTDAFTTGYDAAGIYSKMSAFMTGHPDVDLYFDSDWGARDIGKLIGQRSLKGKVYTVGYNTDSTYLDEVQSGDVLATLDQRFDLQSGNWVKGCAEMLVKGTVPSQHQYVPPTVVTPANVAEARQRLAAAS
jgi:ABC-type sugar transport system substrate-binding protein